MEHTTIPECDEESEHPRHEALPALVIVDCPEEPWQLGATVTLRPSRKEAWTVLGRGDELPDDPGPRLRFTRTRPAGVEALPALELRAVSRVQALLWADRDGRVHVRNVGRCRLLVNGQDSESAELAPGDVLQLGRQLMLLVTSRDGALAAPSASYALGEFGEPDGYGIIGESPAIWRLRAEVGFVAARAGHVLVLGASGTGKELVARALHALSERNARPFVTRNAATIPEGIIDAELFGNLRNYPNAGMPERPGLIGQAHGSLLFLDELSELSAALQSHLLRVLDDGEYQRLGEAVTRVSNFRLIAAANRPPESIKDDLRARFRFQIHVADLNARREDVPLLLRDLLRRIALSDPSFAERGDVEPRDAGGARALTPSPGLLLRLLRHEYRGHVRELETLVWAALQRWKGGPLEWPHEANALLVAGAPRPSGLGNGHGHGYGNGTGNGHGNGHGNGNGHVAPFTNGGASEEPSEIIGRALEEHNGHIERTWKALGLKNRYALRRLIAKHQIEVRRRPGR